MLLHLVCRTSQVAKALFALAGSADLGQALQTPSRLRTVRSGSVLRNSCVSHLPSRSNANTVLAGPFLIGISFNKMLTYKFTRSSSVD
jgi:hypothetical protein